MLLFVPGRCRCVWTLWHRRCRTVQTHRHQCRYVLRTVRHWCRSVLGPKCLGSEVSVLHNSTAINETGRQQIPIINNWVRINHAPAAPATPAGVAGAWFIQTVSNSIHVVIIKPVTFFFSIRVQNYLNSSNNSPILVSAACSMTTKHQYQQSNCNCSRTGISVDCEPVFDGQSFQRPCLALQ